MPRKILAGAFVTFIFGCLFEYGSETFSIVTSYVFSSLDKETKGVIKSSEIRRPDNLIARKADYEYAITYVYRVGDLEYIGTRVNYDTRFSNASEIVKKYPRGLQVTVYYDSSHPSSAVLERGLGGTVVLQLMALTVLFVLFLFF